MAAFLFLVTLLALIAHVLANTEKTIFLGPDPNAASVPEDLSALHLDTLAPDAWSLRAQLRAEFPSPEHPQGAATWIVLDGLTPGQRYEVRVCWPATQPTAFALKTYAPSTVYSTPALLSSLQDYSASRQPSNTTAPRKHGPNSGSLLLLQILAAADFFTTDASLMTLPPPVDADVILDPYLANVLPRSLAGTVVYLVVVGAVAYLGLARGARWVIRELVRSSHGHGKVEDEGRRKKVQ
ncbi:hypothetical protein VTJ83DRAFT_6610 [Remersonia thermophila]|uniref:Uncharacterized protein n=1 Tax=Remersonia thermophila TaxID=72144 RepID=A0ABR4D577_9PEZI